MKAQTDKRLFTPVTRYSVHYYSSPPFYAIPPPSHQTQGTSYTAERQERQRHFPVLLNNTAVSSGSRVLLKSGGDLETRCAPANIQLFPRSESSRRATSTENNNNTRATRTHTERICSCHVSTLLQRRKLQLTATCIDELIITLASKSRNVLGPFT